LPAGAAPERFMGGSMSKLQDAAWKKEWEELMVRRLLEVVLNLQRI
jgi:hypothetical protein